MIFVRFVVLTVMTLTGPVSVVAGESAGPQTGSGAGGADWRTVDVTEAFPGSLADLDNPAATNGGVSGVGKGNKGNFAINGKGQMAITYVQGTGPDGDLVVGRSSDGRNWQRHKIKDVDMRNSWFMAGNNVQVAITFVYSGPGPQVEIDDAGNVCLAYLAGDVLATAIWPADGSSLRPGERIVADVPVERCGLTKFDRQIDSFQLHCYGGHFYLVTTPGSAFKDFVRVYELVDRKWQQVGKAEPGKRGTISWDAETGDLYLGVEAYRKNVNGTFPAAFKWNGPTKSWAELQTPAVGLRDAFGITSYPGGGCPALAARNGNVWAVWWQDPGNRLQAAQFVNGHWQSCAKTTMKDFDQQAGWQKVERESLGQGNGIYETDLNWMPQCTELAAFVAKPSGDLVIFICDGNVGRVIHDGRTYPIKFKRGLFSGPANVQSSRLQPEAGKGFELVRSSPMHPHTVSLRPLHDSVYRCCTMNSQSARADDVFVYRFQPSLGR